MRSNGVPEQLSLLDQPKRQRPAGGDDDRQRVTRAREAAEALFAPKRSTQTKALTVNTPAAATPSPAKPRVLGVSLPPVSHEKTEPAIRPAPQMKPTITGSQVARIRTWLRYGMTSAQVAAVYGVAVDEIERALRRV